MKLNSSSVFRSGKGLSAQRVSPDVTVGRLVLPEEMTRELSFFKEPIKYSSQTYWEWSGIWTEL